MDAEKVAKMIKLRSGKSLKVKVMQQVEKTEGDHSVCFILLANALCKLSIIISQSEKEKFKFENEQLLSSRTWNTVLMLMKHRFSKQQIVQL